MVDEKVIAKDNSQELTLKKEGEKKIRRCQEKYINDDETFRSTQEEKFRISTMEFEAERTGTEKYLNYTDKFEISNGLQFRTETPIDSYQLVIHTV